MARTRAEVMRERARATSEPHPVHAEQYGEERARAVAEGRDPNAEGVPMMSGADENSSSHPFGRSTVGPVQIEVTVPERVYSPVQYTSFRTTAVKATVVVSAEDPAQVKLAVRRLREVLEAEARASFDAAMNDYFDELTKANVELDRRRGR